MSDEEKKIIIDEDWKAQVQKEREQAQKQPQEEPAAEPEAPEAETEAEGAPPEASFDALVGSLATQTMFALGAIAPEGQTQVTVNLDQAKFTLDMLEVLRKKTEGNLAPEEKANLDEAAAELQRLYVARVQQVQEQAMREAGIDMDNLRGPGTPPPGA